MDTANVYFIPKDVILDVENENASNSIFMNSRRRRLQKLINNDTSSHNTEVSVVVEEYTKFK